MIYCVGLMLIKGLVFMLDMCINVGVDNILIFCKMFVWDESGECLIIVMIVGNLVMMQVVISFLDECSKVVEDCSLLILKCESMFQVVILVGDILKEVILDYVDEG